jgi:hypothetical protein
MNKLTGFHSQFPVFSVPAAAKKIDTSIPWLRLEIGFLNPYAGRQNTSKL